MKDAIFDDLLQRYLSDDITVEEMKILLGYLRLGHEEDLQLAIHRALQDGRFKNLADPEKADHIFQNIMQAAATGMRSVSFDNATNRRKLTWPLKVAAAILAVIVGTGVFMIVNREEGVKLAQPLKTMKQPAAFTRYLVLPDGSTAILKANSILEYPAEFLTDTREVKLTGEAYFDIRDNQSQPFIIYSEGVKTTVLGTAFNVKAIPGTGQVTVSVARGKVRVENRKKVLAVLLPDQQIVYSTFTAAAAQQKVNTHKVVTDWTTQDMVFESTQMSSIAETLSKRYGIRVIINNALLQQCLVKISFSGTESLHDVLEALCTLTNASVIEETGNRIVLDGEGCQ